MSAREAGVLDIDAVIVARGNAAQLESAFASVQAQVPEGRIVVVAMSAGGGVDDAFTAAHPDVQVVRSKGGIGAARNAGIAATAGEFVLLVDSDVVLDEGCVGPLAARAKMNRKAAVMAPVVTDADGTELEGSFGPFPTMGLEMAEATVDFVAKLPFRKPVPKPETVGTTTEDFVSAACVLLRRSAMEEVGPFDESFAIAFDDVELCNRMFEAGWLVVRVPNASCVLARGGADATVRRADFLHYCQVRGLSSYALAVRSGLAKEPVTL
jgi:N-acetylglucosaminyl-diphospho-decaprenol L-rhamnosyltransferase